MLQAILILFVCQLAGEGLARGLALSAPGPVIGVALLVLLLALHLKATGRDALDEDRFAIASTSDTFLRHLALLFVPAGCGVFALAPVLGPHAPALLLALVVSTIITLVVTVLVFSGVRRLLAPKAGDAP
jgi:holin-like protein